ncbi:MAG: zinc-dependent alcohol dehydrogenase [Acidimicrobiales bacterium]
MRGVRNTDDGIRVVDVPPRPDGAVRVRVAASGICGSDLHLVSFGPSAVTLGHEFCGRLDDGSPVAVLPVRSCGDCEHCRAGDEQLCAQALGSLYGISLDGGLADEAWVDPRCAKPLPATLALSDACLVEPIAVALHGINRAGVTAGARILVIGAGPIGLCTIAAARNLGADVDLVANRVRRVESGERLGARPIAGAGAGGGASSGYDIVLDAAGVQGSMDRAVELVRPGGTVGMLGSFWDPVVLDLGFQMKEVNLVPAFTYGHHHGSSEFEDAVRVLEAVPELPDLVITHRFPLDEAADAFRVAGDRRTDAIKVVVEP